MPRRQRRNRRRGRAQPEANAGYVRVRNAPLGRTADPDFATGGEACGKLTKLAAFGRTFVRSALALVGVVALAGAGGFAGFVFVEVKSATGEIVLNDVVRKARHPTEDLPVRVATAQVPPAPASCPPLTAVDPPWMLAGPPPPPSHDVPEAPRSLERRIAFWTKVWGERGDNQHYLVDERRPWIVHAEVDCRDLFSTPGTSAGTADVDTAKNSCGSRLTQARRAAQASLKKDWTKPSVLRLYDGDKKLAKTAHQSLIAIQGRKDALKRATDRAAPHLGHAEGLFANEEVPRIYARAAIVESLWRPEALSRSGAAGAYQFMAKTGRQFLAVEEGIVDERLDPLRASWAAARYMSQMAKSLDKWPLVLTAYNTGPARMKKVMKVRGTEDIGKIADAGDFGEFGFDGQNYYAQIAAIGRLTKDEVFEPKPITGRAVRVEQPLTFAELASCVESPKDALAKANPALAAAVIEGATMVPAGYVAHVPSPTVATASVVDTKTLTSTTR
jgi:membrane-bound lytic murein transglycosylase D